MQENISRNNWPINLSQQFWTKLHVLPWSEVLQNMSFMYSFMLNINFLRVYLNILK